MSLSRVLFLSGLLSFSCLSASDASAGRKIAPFVPQASFQMLHNQSLSFVDLGQLDDAVFSAVGDSSEQIIGQHRYIAGNNLVVTVKSKVLAGGQEQYYGVVVSPDQQYQVLDTAWASFDAIEMEVLNQIGDSSEKIEDFQCRFVSANTIMVEVTSKELAGNREFLYMLQLQADGRGGVSSNGDVTFVDMTALENFVFTQIGDSSEMVLKQTVELQPDSSVKVNVMTKDFQNEFLYYLNIYTKNGQPTRIIGDNFAIVSEVEMNVFSEIGDAEEETVSIEHSFTSPKTIRTLVESRDRVSGKRYYYQQWNEVEQK